MNHLDSPCRPGRCQEWELAPGSRREQRFAQVGCFVPAVRVTTLFVSNSGGLQPAVIERALEFHCRTCSDPLTIDSARTSESIVSMKAFAAQCWLC